MTACLFSDAVICLRLYEWNVSVGQRFDGSWRGGGGGGCCAKYSRTRKFDGSNPGVFSLGIINNNKCPSNTTGLLWLEWQHVSILLGHHQAFTVNQLIIKLRTFLWSQPMFTIVHSFISSWLIVKAWWWPSRIETCCHSNHNKPVVFDGNLLLLIIHSRARL